MACFGDLDNLVACHQSSVDSENEWRRQAEKWYDYYHGDQLSPEEIETLRERHQPEIILNHVAPTINLIIGQENRTRTDTIFIPVEDNDEPGAKALTDSFRQLSESQDLDYVISDSFLDAAVTGRGWIEICIDDFKRSGKMEKDIAFRHVPWEEIYTDPLSRQSDYSDAKFIMRERWFDPADLIAEFPDKEELIQGARSSALLHQSAVEKRGQQYQAKRERVNIIEFWWRESDPDSIEGNIMWAAFCPSGKFYLSSPTDSPYKHKSFPFVPIFGLRDRHGKCYGVTKNLVSPQDMVNKMHSKSVHIMATNKLLIEEGAITRSVEQVKREWAKPDGAIMVNEGALANGRIREVKDIAGADIALKLYADSVAAFSRISGVNEELRGQPSANARSGLAIELRQLQGSVMISKLFDNLRRAKRSLARMSLELMAQYYKAGRLLRTVPQIIDEGQRNLYTLNDPKGLLRYDVVIREQVDTPTANADALQSLAELAKAAGLAPNASAEIFAEMAMASNLPNKKRIAEAARSAAAAANQGQPAV